jgi:putative transposase
MPCLQPRYRPSFSADQQQEAAALVRKRRAPQSEVLRARLARLLAETPAISRPEAASRLGLHEQTVRKWRRRWSKEGWSLHDQPRPGRPPVFSPARARGRQGGRMRSARAV